ncbi:MAG TPA: transglycosylase SLT domain-containing protein [Thermoanaerobaculia bacterium]|jgi:membrane-bound lytic murein transglycosylase D
MTKTNSALLLLAVFAAACGSAPAPPPKAAPPVAAKPAETPEYRKALEDAYAQILAREKAPVPAPKVDVEAAASIPIPEHKTIRGALAYFTTELKPSIQESLIRSAKYKKLIDSVFGEAKLPKGLAYLPVIESAYVPTLTSRAGAHGIWQFMPDTAREYGLRVDWWVDERADPERSTRAAAAYLRDLYRQFNDWPLTLAAYNAGPGRIRRALETNGASTFWELCDAGAVPKETRGYVPTFFATLIIASDPATYGFRLGMEDRHSCLSPVSEGTGKSACPPPVASIPVEGPLSLRYVASVADVDEAVLRDLNPALRHGIAPPGRSEIRVPAKAAEAVATRAGTMKNDDANVAVCSFTLRDGDSLSRLAAALGTTAETLAAMNDGKSARQGDSIYLPVRARELSAALSNMTYAVRKGDTYFSIAKKFGLTVEELLELNDLQASHVLHPGDRLRVAPARAVTAGGM